MNCLFTGMGTTTARRMVKVTVLSIYLNGINDECTCAACAQLIAEHDRHLGILIKRGLHIYAKPFVRVAFLYSNPSGV